MCGLWPERASAVLSASRRLDATLMVSSSSSFRASNTMLRDFIDLTDFCNFVINDRRPEQINCRSSERTPRVSAVVSYANDIVNVASIQLNILSFHQSIRNARLEKITPAFHAINLFFPLFSPLFSFCFSLFMGRRCLPELNGQPLSNCWTVEIPSRSLSSCFTRSEIRT